jgi:arginyl-tRNA synthetase
MKGDKLVGGYYVYFNQEYKAELEIIRYAADMASNDPKVVALLTSKNPGADNVDLLIEQFLIAAKVAALKNVINKRNPDWVNPVGSALAELLLAVSNNDVKELEKVDAFADEWIPIAENYDVISRDLKKRAKEILKEGTGGEESEKVFELMKELAPLHRQAQDMLRKWEANDPEVRALWSKMNGWVYDGFNATYKRIGVEFDKIYYESQTYVLGKQDVALGLSKGVFYTKEDGSVWVDNTAEGLDEKVLQRGDGTSLYMTQDIGTATKRFEEFPGLSRLIYTVGNEQDYHFKVLFLILKKLGYAWADGLYHLSYGMVDLPSGKMKSREGTVVDADEIIEETVNEARKAGEELSKLDDFSEEERSKLFEMIGLAALKYFLLKVDPKKRMLFDPAASIDLHGHTGPFIQYTYARIQSVYSKVMLVALTGSWKGHDVHSIPKVESMVHAPVGGLLPEERAVLKLIHQFPSILNEAANKLEPSALANHAYELAKTYNTFYNALDIRDEPDWTKATFRLSLSRNTARAIRRAMWCLGIEVPERM